MRQLYTNVGALQNTSHLLAKTNTNEVAGFNRKATTTIDGKNFTINFNDKMQEGQSIKINGENVTLGKFDGEKNGFNFEYKNEGNTYTCVLRFDNARGWQVDIGEVKSDYTAPVIDNNNKQPDPAAEKSESESQLPVTIGNVSSFSPSGQDNTLNHLNIVQTQSKPAQEIPPEPTSVSPEITNEDAAIQTVVNTGVETAEVNIAAEAGKPVAPEKPTTLSPGRAALEADGWSFVKGENGSPDMMTKIIRTPDGLYKQDAIFDTTGDGDFGRGDEIYHRYGSNDGTISSVTNGHLTADITSSSQNRPAQTVASTPRFPNTAANPAQERVVTAQRPNTTNATQTTFINGNRRTTTSSGNISQAQINADPELKKIYNDTRLAELNKGTRIDIAENRARVAVVNHVANRNQG